MLFTVLLLRRRSSFDRGPGRRADGCRHPLDRRLACESL